AVQSKRCWCCGYVEQAGDNYRYLLFSTLCADVACFSICQRNFMFCERRLYDTLGDWVCIRIGVLCHVPFLFWGDKSTVDNNQQPRFMCVLLSMKSIGGEAGSPGRKANSRQTGKRVATPFLYCSVFYFGIAVSSLSD
ncbi:unnamed protein product, partial [Pylaiella littoralis]